MKTAIKSLTLLLAVAIVVSATTALRADPLPGQQLKFQQIPMLGTPIDGVVYPGHDELSTAYGELDPATGQTRYTGTSMADDFADRFDTPVVHVRWWGSYLDNFISADQTVDKFLIAFESDVPADPLDPTDFSHPGVVLSSQIVDRGVLSPGSGTFTEKQLTFGTLEDVWEYNAELHLGKEFNQDPDEVYWLKIVALIDGTQIVPGQNTQWGWHNRDYTVMDPFASVAPAVSPGEADIQPIIDPGYPSEVWHFQDDAVSATVDVLVDTLTMPNMPLNVSQFDYAPQNYIAGFDGPGPGVTSDGTTTHGGIGQFSKDLAFELYTVAIPEPSSVVLMMLGLASLAGFRRRRSM